GDEKPRRHVPRDTCHGPAQYPGRERRAHMVLGPRASFIRIDENNPERDPIPATPASWLADRFGPQQAIPSALHTRSRREDEHVRGIRPRDDVAWVEVAVMAQPGFPIPVR